jgi:iron-sulfur cluster assembly protein
MVQELEATSAEAVVNITDKAAEKAAALLKDRGIEDGALRVFVVGGGCSGYQYGMAISRGREEGDYVLEKGGVTVLVDQESIPLMKGAEIDYVDDIMKSGFTIFNPNAVKGCACGSSFQTADGGGQAKSCC